MARLHLALTVMWGVLIVPTLLWWRDSILWILIMSLWANLSTHWSAWQAARTEQVQREQAGLSDPADEALPTDPRR